MSSDIVNRLQAELYDPQGHIVILTTVDADLLRDAKAEIVRLREADEDMDELCDIFDCKIAAKDVEIEQLRAECDAVRAEMGRLRAEVAVLRDELRLAGEEARRG